MPSNRRMRRLSPAIFLLAFAGGGAAGGGEVRYAGNRRCDYRLPPPGARLRDKAGAPRMKPKGEFAFEKIAPADSRFVRGFSAALVDGRIDSRYGGKDCVLEFPMAHWDGVFYEYNRNGSAHVMLSDAEGFDYVFVRGGFEGALYRDGGPEPWTAPGQGVKVCDLPGSSFFFRKRFGEPVKSARLSFYPKKASVIAEASFYRIGKKVRKKAYGRPLYFVAAPNASVPASIAKHVNRFARASCKLTATAPYKEATDEMALQAHAWHTFALPLPDDLPVGAVAVMLQPETWVGETHLSFEVLDPVIGTQELIAADLVVEAGPGAVRVILDFPDLFMPPGRGALAVRVGVDKALKLGKGKLRFDVLPTSKEAARHQAVPYRKLFLKDRFYVLSEGRPWAGGSGGIPADLEGAEKWASGIKPGTQSALDLARCLVECVRIAPQDPVVKEYRQWLSGKRDPMELKLPGEPGAPRWAVLAREGLKATGDMVGWWLKNRLVPSGELGGFVDDDTDFYQQLLTPGFADSALRPALWDAMGRFAEFAEKNLDRGLNKNTMDGLHAAEAGFNHRAVMHLVRYGDPVYVERIMESTRSIRAMMMETKKGHLHFLTNEVGAKLLDKPPAPKGGAWDGFPSAQPITAGAWYCRLPQTMEVLKKYWGGWVEHQHAEGERAYAYMVTLPADEESAWDRKNRVGAGAYNTQAFGWLAALEVTRDPFYARPFLYAWDRKHFCYRTARFVPGLAPYVDLAKYKEGLLARTEGKGYGAFLLSGDVKAAESGIEAALAELRRFRHMYTAAEPCTDRVFPPWGELYLAVLGGCPARNAWFPLPAVSYEGFGRDFGALVAENRPDRLRVALFNFKKEPLRGAVRIWNLDHGKYEMRFGPDADADFKPDAGAETKVVEAIRHAPLEIVLPPRKVVVLSLEQKEKLDPIAARADLAIAARECKLDAGTLTVTVHNLGAKPTPEAAIVLIDENGKTVARGKVPAIPPPLDWLPKTATVTLSGAKPGWRVAVDPENKVPEITEENNVVAIP